MIPLGVPIERVPGAAVRDIAALAYAGNPHKRGLEVLAAAWAAPGSTGGWSSAGSRRRRAARGSRATASPEPPGIEWAGVIPRPEWLALLGRARLYVNASRFEDHGIAPLEALSAGAALVSLPTPGPYPALRMARALAPALVSTDLAARAARRRGARRPADYARRADALLAPHRSEALRRTVAEEVLPALGMLAALAA